jgi:hypothetical protein
MISVGTASCGSDANNPWNKVNNTIRHRYIRKSILPVAVTPSSQLEDKALEEVSVHGDGGGDSEL